MYIEQLLQVSIGSPLTHTYVYFTTMKKKYEIQDNNSHINLNRIKMEVAICTRGALIHSLSPALENHTNFSLEMLYRELMNCRLNFDLT